MEVEKCDKDPETEMDPAQTAMVSSSGLAGRISCVFCSWSLLYGFRTRPLFSVGWIYAKHVRPLKKVWYVCGRAVDRTIHCSSMNMLCMLPFYPYDRRVVLDKHGPMDAREATSNMSGPRCLWISLGIFWVSLDAFCGCLYDPLWSCMYLYVLAQNSWGGRWN